MSKAARIKAEHAEVDARGRRLLERAIEAEERAERAEAEITRVRRALHLLIGDGDEQVGINALGWLRRARSAEAMVREASKAGCLPDGWVGRAQALLGAARLSDNEARWPGAADAESLQAVAAQIDALGAAMQTAPDRAMALTQSGTVQIGSPQVLSWPSSPGAPDA